MFCADISRREKKKNSLFTGVDKTAGCKLRPARGNCWIQDSLYTNKAEKEKAPYTQFKPLNIAMSETSHIFQLTSPLSQ